MTTNPTSRLEDPADAQRGSRGPQVEQPHRVHAPLVSVVIPCYNQAHFLSEAIESVLAQTYAHFEIVVVDDGSADNTSEVAARYPNVRCIRQDNQGLSGARNTGIRHSRGEYLVFLDADDRLVPKALEVGLECLEAHPECAFASGNWKPIAADGSPLPISGWGRPAVESDLYAALLQRNYIGMPAVAMHRRTIFEVVGGFDASLRACEDYDLYLRIARMFPVCSHDKVVAEYRTHSTNMSGNHALMLGTTVSVLRSQRENIKGKRQYEEAYRTGLRFWRDWYGDPLADNVRTHLREGEWRLAARGAWTLLRYYPQGLALAANERYWLAKQLKARDKQLWGRNQRIRKLRSALKKERSKVERLREQNRSLELQAQDLQRQLQTVQNSRTGKLLKRVDYIRAKYRRPHGA